MINFKIFYHNVDLDIIKKKLNVNKKKVDVIKAVRTITGLGLKDAKALVDGAPSTIKEGLTKAEAQEYLKQLVEAGAKAELK